MKPKQFTVTYEYNFYDLNMTQTLKEDLPHVLNTEKITNPRFEKDHFLSQVWKSVEMYCRDNGLDYDYLLKSPPSTPIIIDSSHYLYFHFLEITLMFYDPFLIKHFLSYQFNNFKGTRDAKNKEEFLAKLLFVGYTHINLNSPNNNLHRKEKIFDWLETHNVENLPERFGAQQASIADQRYRGNLTPEEVQRYWMQLCAYKSKGKVVEVLSEPEVKQFLHANFWGFNPLRKVEKLTIRNVTQAEFRKFCKAFFDRYTENNRTQPFIRILKNNFSIFDDTSESTLTKNFSK